MLCYHFCSFTLCLRRSKRRGQGKVRVSLNPKLKAHVGAQKFVRKFTKFYFKIVKICCLDFLAKQYKRINHLALEAMAVLFCGLNSVKISQVCERSFLFSAKTILLVQIIKYLKDLYFLCCTILRE
jgi:hypothetical protein